MGLKLYSFPGSACGQRVAVVLNEKGIPFEFKLVDFAAGDIKTPEFLEKQPFGQVPYIVSYLPRFMQKARHSVLLEGR